MYGKKTKSTIISCKDLLERMSEDYQAYLRNVSAFGVYKITGNETPADYLPIFDTIILKYDTPDKVHLAGGEKWKRTGREGECKFLKCAQESF